MVGVTLLSACQTAGPYKPDYSAFEEWKAISPEESQVYFADPPVQPYVIRTDMRWVDGYIRDERITARVGRGNELSMIFVRFAPVVFDGQKVLDWVGRTNTFERSKKLCKKTVSDWVERSKNHHGSFNYVPCYDAGNRICIFAMQKMGETGLGDQQTGYRTFLEANLCSRTLVTEELLSYFNAIRLKH